MHISTNNKSRLNSETNTENEIKGRKQIQKTTNAACDHFRAMKAKFVK